MDIAVSPHIQPLKIANRQFLQVLVDEFRLGRRPSGGRTLTLRLNDDTPTIWNNEGRRLVRESVAADNAAVKRAAATLNEAWNGTPNTDPVRFPIPFRYANGGALPVVRRGTQDYYCLIYREIFPIGWNIANGGSDNRHELLHPFDIVDRELREELVVFNPRKNRRYVFQGDADKPSDWPEFAVARRIIERSSPGLSFRHMEVVNLAYKWIDGPDMLIIEIDGQPPIPIYNCYLNVNAEDFGIEVDRVVRFLIEPDDVIIDAETLETGPLTELNVVNAPIGLFRVDRIDDSLDKTNHFMPDAFFHDGRFYENGADVEAQVNDVFLHQVSRHLRPQQMQEYRETDAKFDMCPVTRRIIGRYKTDRAVGQQMPDAAYDVFISYAQEDVTHARQLADYLDKQRHKRVFIGDRDIHAGPWSEPIDRAIESPSCTHMFVVATSRDHLLKPAVSFEYRAFHQHILSRRKPATAVLMALIGGFDFKELPMPLHHYQGRQFEPGHIGQALEGLRLD